MTFNRIQLLRNSPIKILRDDLKSFIYIQGPTIGDLYDDEIYFFSLQLMTMPMEDLQKFLNVTNKKLTRIEIINIVLKEAEEKEMILQSLKKIILQCDFTDNFLEKNDIEISNEEMKKISRILKVIMGQEKYEEYDGKEEKELTELEIKQKLLEEKIQKKKKTEKPGTESEDKNVLEDIIISLTYEFGLKIEDIMNMNYFTVL
jgi:hypothetical protein